MILGITGAFGCGKSAVLSHFAARGWQTADADQLCHEFYQERDPSFLSALTGRWGKQVSQGRALGKIFTSKDEALNVIEKAILLYRDQGYVGERFANTIERLGFENVEKQLLSDEILDRKEEILTAELKTK